MKTSDCIILHDAIETNSFCASSSQALSFYINGERHSEISTYSLNHKDRILISFGDEKLISGQLEYLETLKIFDVPKKTPQRSGNDISI